MCLQRCTAPGYVYMSESDDRSGAAMGEKDIETAKSEFRLGIKCILYIEFIYREMRKGKCNLGVYWPGQVQQGNYYLV